MTPFIREKKSTEAVLEEIQTLYLLNKDFKSATLNMFNELKEATYKELKV